MRLLGIDFETTGLSPETDDVIEVGMCVWDTEHRQPIILDGFFVNWGKTISEEVTKLNGVHDSYVREFGLFQGNALDRIMKLMARTEYVVAHNGELFDKPFYKEWFKRIFSYSDPDPKIWIDTRTDIDYPEGVRGLKYIAADHGFLNPFAHRAVFDVLTMMVIMDKYPLDEIIYSAQQPTIMVQCLVSYDDRQKAKDAGFYWDGERKQWRKSIKQHKYKPEEFPFKTRII